MEHLLIWFEHFLFDAAGIIECVIRSLNCYVWLLDIWFIAKLFWFLLLNRTDFFKFSFQRVVCWAYLPRLLSWALPLQVFSFFLYILLRLCDFICFLFFVLLFLSLILFFLWLLFFLYLSLDLLISVRLLFFIYPLFRRLLYFWLWSLLLFLFWRFLFFWFLNLIWLSFWRLVVFILRFLIYLYFLGFFFLIL